MAWVRLDDGAMDHPKILKLSDTQFRLWVRGLCYCQKYLTDGFIPDQAIRPMLGRAGDVKRLCDVSLWDVSSGGFWVHDYLAWNDCRADVEVSKRLARDRMMFMRSPELRKELQGRDGYFCRYCGRRVNWLDRKGALGATYDHVDPRGDATIDNLVVACRGCNSSKKNRTPQEAGMILLPVPSPTKLLQPQDLDQSRSENLDPPRNDQALIPSHPMYKEEKIHTERSRVRLSGTADPEIARRAGDFHREWEKLFCEHRFGATYLGNSQADYDACCRLVEKFTDARLGDLAVVFLNSNEPFIESSTRSVPVFASRISWCDVQLRKAEAQQRRSA